jgi:hypothetical protein
MNGNTDYYHRMSSPSSRSPSHSPSPLFMSSPINGRSSETIIHKSAFKVILHVLYQHVYLMIVFLCACDVTLKCVACFQMTNSNNSKYVDSPLKSRSSPVNLMDRQSPSITNNYYKNSRSNNNSIKYLNTSSNIRGTLEIFILFLRFFLWQQ